MFPQSWWVWRARQSSEYPLVMRHRAGEIFQLVAGIRSFGVVLDHLNKTSRVGRHLPIVAVGAGRGSGSGAFESMER